MELSAKYIVIEGAEAVGKDTQVELLKNFFNKNSVNFIDVHEPTYHTKPMKIIRKLIKEEKDIHDETRALLHAAVRAELVETLVRPALDSGINVISNRSYVSTLVYQGLIYGLNMKDLKSIINFCMKDIEIDYLFILRVPPEISWERIKKRKNYQLDVVEEKGLVMCRQLDDAYKSIAKNLNGHLIDSSKPIRDVHSDIVTKIISKNANSKKSLF